MGSISHCQLKLDTQAILWEASACTKAAGTHHQWACKHEWYQLIGRTSVTGSEVSAWTPALLWVDWNREEMSLHQWTLYHQHTRYQDCQHKVQHEIRWNKLSEVRVYLSWSLPWWQARGSCFLGAYLAWFPREPEAPVWPHLVVDLPQRFFHFRPTVFFGSRCA